MKYIKYFIQYIIIKILFFVFKIIGYKSASNLGEFIGKSFGPLIKSKKVAEKNIKIFNPNLKDENVKDILKEMWGNYGRILSEYVFIKDFRSNRLQKHLRVKGHEHLKEIKDEGKPVVFVSAHFNNFELMAMQIEKSGIDLAAVYRPLNNIFLNSTMEQIRKKYICKTQIKKGLSGVREILKLFKNNCSIAMMIDQRVTEGIKINFFGKPAFTTSIPAQLVKKFNCPIVVIYIERKNKIDFEITINKPIYFNKNENLEKISEDLNLRLEKMISNNPEQWIWSHNRWKL